MSRSGFGPSALASLTVLLISVGIDIHAVISAQHLGPGASQAKPGFIPIGPRRYPPGYRAAAFISPGDPSASHASHQTVIKNQGRFSVTDAL